MPRLQVLLAALYFATTGTAHALGPADTDPVGVGATRILVGGALLAAVAVATRGGVRGPRWAAATVLACAGVALLALAGGEASVSVPGVAMAVLAGASYATYTIAAKRLLSAGHRPEAVTAAAFGLGAFVLLPALVLSTPGWLLQADGIALALFLGVIPTALAYVLFARGLNRLTASETATLTLAEPLTAMSAAGAGLVLAEPLTAMSAAGAGLVLAGLLALAVRVPVPAVATPERAPA